MAVNSSGDLSTVVYCDWLLMDLEEMEKSREETLDDYQKFSEQKIKQYSEDNKELQDKYDELTVEVEDLRQQVSSHRRRRGYRADGSGNSAPTLLDEASLYDNQPDQSDEDSPLSDSGPQRRRQLPTPPTETSPTAAVSEAELRRCFSMERKDIEDVFKLEIVQLEDSHMREKNDLLKGFKREKEQLAAEFEAAQAEAVEAERQRLLQQFEEDKKDLLIRHQSEKNLMEQKFAEEKVKMLARMRKEQEEELEYQLGEQRTQYTSELEETVSRDDEQLKQQIANLQLQLKLQKEEQELAHEKEKQQMLDRFDDQRAQMDAKHTLKIHEYETMFEQGPSHLKGRLKAEFDKAVEQETAQIVSKEKEFLLEQFDAQREAMQRDLATEREAMEKGIRTDLELSLKSDKESLESSLERERERMEAEMEEERQKTDEMWQRQKDELLLEIQTERDAMNANFEREKSELERRQREKVGRLEEALQQEKHMLEVERDRFRSKFKREKEKYDRELKDMKANVEEQISVDMQARMEEEFVSQLERLRAAFDEERRELQAQISLLEQEVTELNESHARDQERHSTQIQQLTTERRKATTGDKDKMAEQQRKFQAEKNELEDRIHQLIVEKEEAVHAVKVEKTRATKPSSSPDNKLEHERAVKENRALEESGRRKDERIRDLEQQVHEATLHKAKLARWEEEKASLQEQLDITAQKLAEAESSLALTRSEQVRSSEAVREAMAGMVDRAEYTALQRRLEEVERQAAQAKQTAHDRAAHTTQLINNSHEDQQRSAQRLQSEKEALQDRLDIAKKLLEEQIGKLKMQLQKNAKSDILVKDLYVENAHLVKCLQVTEKREKDAEKRVYKLEDKCKALTKLVYKIAPAALSY